MGGCSDAKVTTMILSVDLDCCPCYRKVKKLFCKFPQIRDQVYDEKQNTITITVVCCSPEKIMDKLFEKGGKSIKGIAIKESNKGDPDKSKPKSKGGDEQIKEKKEKAKEGNEEMKEKKEKAKEGNEEMKEKKEKAKEGNKEMKEKKEKAKGGEDEKPKSKSVEKVKNKEKEKEKEKGSSGEKGTKLKEAPLAPTPAPTLAPAVAAAQVRMAEPAAQWVPAYPPGPMYPVSVYYGGPSSCYDGVPVAPPCYQNQQGYGYSYGHPASYSHSCDYLSDENPDACTIM